MDTYETLPAILTDLDYLFGLLLILLFACYMLFGSPYNTLGEFLEHDLKLSFKMVMKLHNLNQRCKER